MITVELFIPLAANDGQRFDAAHHDTFEAFLAGLFNGFSRLPGVVAGGWQHEGRVYRDELVVYVVALRSLTEGDKVREAVAFAKSHYDQLAIFIRYLGVSEVL